MDVVAPPSVEAVEGSGRWECVETEVVTTEVVVEWHPGVVAHFVVGPAAGVDSSVGARERWEATTTRDRLRNATLTATGGLNPLRSNLSTTHSGTRILMASNGVNFSLCCQSR